MSYYSEHAVTVLEAAAGNLLTGQQELSWLAPEELEGRYWTTLKEVSECVGRLAVYPDDQTKRRLGVERIVSSFIVYAIDRAYPNLQPPRSAELRAAAQQRYGDTLADIEPYFDFTGQLAQVLDSQTAKAH